MGTGCHRPSFTQLFGWQECQQPLFPEELLGTSCWLAVIETDRYDGNSIAHKHTHHLGPKAGLEMSENYPSGLRHLILLNSKWLNLFVFLWDMTAGKDIWIRKDKNENRLVLNRQYNIEEYELCNTYSLLIHFIWHSAVINLEERLLVPFGGQKSEQLNKTGCAFGETNISALFKSDNWNRLSYQKEITRIMDAK